VRSPAIFGGGRTASPRHITGRGLAACGTASILLAMWQHRSIILATEMLSTKHDSQLHIDVSSTASSMLAAPQIVAALWIGILWNGKHLACHVAAQVHRPCCWNVIYKAR